MVSVQGGRRASNFLKVNYCTCEHDSAVHDENIVNELFLAENRNINPQSRSHFQASNATVSVH